ncbi:MAG: GNAT family N-acetyltransferase [Clostridiales bacterium]|jgi:ribosomal-protein-alanine N-acetyltransferase|nr:GNAT family N-acetyltransferase [Clostridiales bacterium]
MGVIDDGKFPPVLETERLILRPMELADAADIFKHAGDEETVRYMLWNRHTSIYDTIDFVNMELARYENKKSFDYAIVLKENVESDENGKNDKNRKNAENSVNVKNGQNGGRLIGTGGVFDASDLPHKAAIGYILNKDYWGRGFATEAMRAVVGFLTAELRVHRIEAYHTSENAASGRVMQKLGMKYEGMHIDSLYLRGRYFTTVHYALING